MPKKIRELKAMLRKAGFICLPKRGKGSHSVWQHPLLPYNITLAGNDGDDAQRYQEKDVRNALQEVKQPGGEDDTTL
ncbi:type II toxin-antitoxin system HicA family toxin [Gloeocapsopsis crepidinum LEGE 06123]|jgi:predicted RNA binding protein YcfA (HicA-like mRNA interferase family)|uniref:Type II toxin-antitoxin system HicA family toxin n=1 Tax=Gloeocapsopsis crepidinum LEGE 06123 TaxID=588587 RepID=A0ABR9UQA3_9CHRO|nr:type II toxin-antitoxin system HicA family toxin [Gloeocapsopsis crepidinum]MBE9190456.1 type II toxin-antitoxin system HicA family toxin [Gloeocapsopsis crepidinum LEGE 06123]